MQMRVIAWGVLFSLAFTGQARAQTTAAPDTQRRELLEQAVQASDAGDHRHAIELFEQAGRIETRPGLRVSMAEEYQALGQTQRACEMSTRGEIEAQTDLSRHSATQVLQRGIELIAQTCGHFARVRLHLPTPLPTGIRVTVNGRRIEDIEQEDVAATEAGSVQVTATVPQAVPFVEDLTLREGETRDVTVVMPVQIAPPSAPPPTPRTREVSRWYGWQILISDVLSGPAFAAAVSSSQGGPYLVMGAAGAALYLCEPMFVHGFHDRLFAGGFVSLGLRLAMPLLGALVAGGADGFGATPVSIGLAGGMVFASAIDIVFLAREVHSVPADSASSNTGWTLGLAPMSGRGVGLATVGSF